MPSNDEKTVSFPAENKGKKDPKNKKYGKSIGWFFGIGVLLLLCVTFVLPATLFTSNQSEIVFGSYDGKDIALSYDSYFYYQLQNIADYYAENYNGAVPTDAWFTIYYTAFQNAAVFEAISELADAAKIQPTEKAISETIVASGYWNNADGVFDTERYQAATSADKASITNYAAMMVPFQMVTSDIYGARVSDAETEFVASLSTDTRDFEYYMIDNDDFGNAEAVAYAKNNAEPFMTAELSIVSYLTKAEAEEAIAKIQSGEIIFEEAAINSNDNYAEVAGYMGAVPKYHLDSILSSEAGASDAVFATEVGGIAGPFPTAAGYSFFKVEKAPAEPDYEDATALASIKDYIEANDNALLLGYIGGVAQDVYKEAQTDFDAAGEKYNLTLYSVKSAAENPGNSDLILSMNYSDYMGYLAAAANDAEYSEKLFSAAENEVLAPVLVSNSTYVVARPVASTPASEYMLSLVVDMYGSAAGEYALADLENSILMSDKLVDNFVNTYLSNILVSSSTVTQ